MMGSVIGEDTEVATRAQDRTRSASKRRRTEGASTARPSTQVAGAQVSRIKGRRGHLKFMTEIPLDTLHEIFRKLDPVDLLHLSRASKTLRTIVMEKSARYIWEEAFERLYASENPPPPCPEDLNLAQYANFLFIKKCMQCQTAAGCWSSWPLRLRVCWSCLQSDHFGFLYQKRNYAVICAKGRLFSPSYNFHKEGPCHSECTHTYDQTNPRKEGSDIFAKWEENQRNEREGELEQVRLKRQTAIFGRLEEIGWTESEVRDISHGNINRLPTFTRAKKLTEKCWDVLQPQLIKSLQQLKTARIEEKRLARVIHRWEVFNTQVRSWQKKQNRPFLPSPIDLAFYEPFKSVIFFPGEEKHVKFSLDDIDRVDKEWSATRDKIIASLLPKEYSAEIDLDGGSHLPPLAAFMFRIIESGYDPRPRSCYHIGWVCHDFVNLFSDDPPCCSPPPEDLAILAFIHKNKGSWPDANWSDRPWLWDHTRIHFYPEAHSLMKDLLSFLELDPRTTTLPQMRAHREKVKCGLCDGYVHDAVCYAIDHQLEDHFRGASKELTPDKRWKKVIKPPS